MLQVLHDNAFTSTQVCALAADIVAWQLKLNIVSHDDTEKQTPITYNRNEMSDLPYTKKKKKKKSHNIAT